MNYRLELHPSIHAELEDSYLWYEERSEGLGGRFVIAVNKALAEIIKLPEIHAKKQGNYCVAVVDIFPYVIVFKIHKKDKYVFVSYIFHTKRNPRIKYKR